MSRVWISVLPIPVMLCFLRSRASGSERTVDGSLLWTHGNQFEKPRAARREWLRGEGIREVKVDGRIRIDFD